LLLTMEASIQRTLRARLIVTAAISVLAPVVAMSIVAALVVGVAARAFPIAIAIAAAAGVCLACVCCARVIGRHIDGCLADERWRADDELRAEMQRLSRVIEQTADSVFVTDRAGRIEYVNPAFEELTGYSRQEAVGSTPRLFASGLHDQGFYADLWGTITAGGVFRAVVTNKTKDGRLFDEDQTITPIRDSHGVITHFVSTGRDITRRKRTEQALRRLNQMLEEETTRIASLLHDEAGQFLTAAHIVLADVARDLPSPFRERLHEVRGSLDQVEAQLRTLSHDLHPRILDDLGLVGSIRFRAEAFARRTGIHTSVDALQDYKFASGVQTVLYRLVQEALNNIGKHARATSVEITLRDDGQRICCSIRDDGVGFAVTETFGPAGEPRLGLLGMRDRVEAIGGVFEIISAPKQGTDLRASVPLER
jgi:two-component system, NarL family, sensor histidine kinase NreB